MRILTLLFATVLLLFSPLASWGDEGSAAKSGDLTTLDANLDPLVSDFNAHEHGVRVIILLSPT